MFLVGERKDGKIPSCCAPGDGLGLEKKPTHYLFIYLFMIGGGGVGGGTEEQRKKDRETLKNDSIYLRE